ncbi:MAG TPA: DUF3300 domain-containing protein [Burkholderiales bacterium]|nr:DUF3300 domain-containing protein [Burkholderiales bacterium]
MKDPVRRFARILAFALSLVTAMAMAQEEAPSFSKEQLDQMVAPIALYPDSLLSQVLMAATYPADVADAAKWSKNNPKQQGESAVNAVESQTWDPSVKSLVAFPQVLQMMGERPDWVQNIGDAFLASSKDVLDSVQRLRTKAQQSGNLKSNEQQKVIVEEAPTQVIKIEPANPEVIYVPSYNPTVVYGPWPYPAYPPYYYPPPPAYYPGYAYGGVALAFGVGMVAGGALWGDCDWNNGDVDIDVDKHNNINRNKQIDRSQKKFEHNAGNRRGVPYRDSKSQQRFGKDVPGASDRSNYRGRDSARDTARDTQRRQAEASLQDRGMDPARDRDRLRNDPQTRDRAQSAARDTDRSGFRGEGDRSGGIDRSGGRESFDGDRSGDRSRGGYDGGRGSDSALRGAGDGAGARRDFDRGSSSRSSMGSRGSSFGGGSRSGGGFGGGGRGGGGRGGGGRR